MKYTLYIIGFGIGMAFAAHAATVSFEAKNGVVAVVLHAGDNENVNAIEGNIVVPDSLSVRDIRDANSVMPLWIESPHSAGNGIVFSGITPGGFSEKHGFLFSFSLAGAPTATIALARGAYYVNDGQGVPYNLEALPLTFATGLSSAPSSQPPGLAGPESFIPQISRDESVYDGRYFVTFSTTDKESGINHYDILEVPTNPAAPRDTNWRSAVSPELLRDQSLASDIFIRAVNNDGNFIIVKTTALHPYGGPLGFSSGGAKLVLGILVLLVGGTSLFLARRRKRRRI